jgi:hypothetical protein
LPISGCLGYGLGGGSKALQQFLPYPSVRLGGLSLLFVLHPSIVHGWRWLNHYALPFLISLKSWHFKTVKLLRILLSHHDLAKRPFERIKSKKSNMELLRKSVFSARPYAGYKQIKMQVGYLKYGLDFKVHA